MILMDPVELAKREIALYAKAARDYDITAGGIGFEKQAAWLNSAVAGYQVLDLCCGTGRYFEHVNCSEVVGVDLSLEMLSIAKLRATDRTHLVLCSVNNLPFRSSIFDSIYSIGSLGVHVPITTKLLRSLRTLLNDNGALVFTSNSLRVHWRQSLIRTLHDIFGIKPTRWYPFQPFSESKIGLRLKLGRAGFLPRITSTSFNGLALVTVAKVARVRCH